MANDRTLFISIVFDVLSNEIVFMILYLGDFKKCVSDANSLSIHHMNKDFLYYFHKSECIDILCSRGCSLISGLVVLFDNKVHFGLLIVV
jgi:hypothetical protein